MAADQGYTKFTMLKEPKGHCCEQCAVQAFKGAKYVIISLDGRGRIYALTPKPFWI